MFFSFYYNPFKYFSYKNNFFFKTNFLLDFYKKKVDFYTQHLLIKY